MEPGTDGVRSAHGTVTWVPAPQALGEGVDVKKIILVLVTAIAGFAVWRKLEADKAEQALWAEVTDPVK
jgi:hypothetical protein